MTNERWLDHHTEAALEDLAYEMNDVYDAAAEYIDFLPLGKVQG